MVAAVVLDVDVIVVGEGVDGLVAARRRSAGDGTIVIETDPCCLSWRSRCDRWIATSLKQLGTTRNVPSQWMRYVE